MKNSMVLSITLVFSSCDVDSSKESNQRVSEGVNPYPGLELPGATPEIFAQGLVSTDTNVESSITFSPKMNELFFNRRSPEGSHNLYTMKLGNGKWSEPVLASFSQDVETLDFHARFSPRGDRLYFGSRRPRSGIPGSSKLRQWYVDKGSSGWSEPVPLTVEPFSDRWIMCTSSAENGNLYFTSKEIGDKVEDDGIYYAIKVGDRYQSVKRMGKEVNFNGKWIAHPYIAPDESYLIFDGEREEGYGDCDLYISFRINGEWSEARNLGPMVNTIQCEGAATVSPDGKYLFFGRYSEETGISNIYWMDFIQLKESLMNE